MDALKEKAERLREVIVNGDAQGFSALMDEFGYGAEKYCDCPKCNRRISLLPGVMSAIVSTSGCDLSKGISDVLIDRIFPKIDFVRFAVPVIAAGGIEEGRYSKVPRKILAAVDDKDYSEAIAKQIGELYPSAVEQLIAFATYEVDGELVPGYIRAIVKAAFCGTNIRPDLLLAFLSASIKPPESKEPDVIPVHVMVVSGGDDVLSTIM